MRSGVINSPNGHCVPNMYSLRSSSVRLELDANTLASMTRMMPSGVVIMLSG